MADLHEMQAVWYLIEMGNRLRKDGKFWTLPVFIENWARFEEFIDDQLDFHAYSLRKMSFVEYIKFWDSWIISSKVDILKEAQIGLSECLMTLMDSEEISIPWLRN